MHTSSFLFLSFLLGIDYVSGRPRNAHTRAVPQSPSTSRNLDNPVTGVVEAIPERNDFEYLSPVQIGTPPQTLNLAINTGSADLQNHTWPIHYGDGSTASGTVFRDTVSLGAVTSRYQTVQSASRISRAFTWDAACPGILGLGFCHGSSVRPGKALTFMDSVRHEFAQEVFTVELKKGRPGRYGFGYVDRGARLGRMGYADVTPRDAIWRFMMDGVQAGNETQGKSEGFAAIADTGTSLLLVPRNVVKTYYGLVEGSGYDVDWSGWVFLCDARLPDWIFWLRDGYRGTVPGSYMVYSRMNGTRCFGGMQRPESIPFAILGDVLLKAQFVVFDFGKRVGFASKVLTS
ncbi:aspartic peptidase domain-containing protein [Immersiella caudata]|uniref:Aspartic peptidase domain-containing protein n=1 Tax=Immersiella caudata TaxID=314043 RepID=A0AA39WVH4_9PEZI|nr:aspartic peptidase domain-containing protein [Immersiella caudata]